MCKKIVISISQLVAYSWLVRVRQRSGVAALDIAAVFDKLSLKFRLWQNTFAELVTVIQIWL